jgi:hypothetical protein
MPFTVWRELHLLFLFYLSSKNTASSRTLQLNATPNGPFIDPRFLNVIDVPFILLAIVLLIVMYFKVKKAKQNNS